MLKPRPLRALAAVVLAAGLFIAGCASVDSFNKIAADVTGEAITASEQNRCAVHPKPCLEDADFKAVNVVLYQVSTAGATYTKLRIAGTATTADASMFLAAVSEATTALSRAFPDGRVGAVLSKLIALQQRAVQLLGTT